MMREFTPWTAPDIVETLDAHADQLRQMGARSLALFGSYRRGTPTADSDLDFLVTFERPSFDAYMALKFLLEDLFGRNVDLVLEPDLKPRLRASILREALYVQGL
jgi:hypothetical protein